MEVSELPVPAGLEQASRACHRLLEFFDVDELTLAAAAATPLQSPNLEETRNEVTTRSSRRTLAQLQQRTAELREQADARAQAEMQAAAKRKAKRQERERQERMTRMVKAPKKWLQEADQLVAQRGTANYRAAAEILSDLREAMGDSEGDRIVRQHAAHLAESHPTLTHLKSSLRKRNLLP